MLSYMKCEKTDCEKARVLDGRFCPEHAAPAQTHHRYGCQMYWGKSCDCGSNETHSERVRERVAEAIHRKNDMCVIGMTWENFRRSGEECGCFPMADAVLKALAATPAVREPGPTRLTPDAAALKAHEILGPREGVACEKDEVWKWMHGRVPHWVFDEVIKRITDALLSSSSAGEAAPKASPIPEH
jgi:hypothetical protein